MEKRWMSLYVENEVGVLAKIAGLFSAKSYNLNSLTVGPTEDSSISRMTISLISDDATFEQVKKQLNRSVEVIKVIDYTTIPIHMKELLFVKINKCSREDKEEIFRIAQVYNSKVVDYGESSVMLENALTEEYNDNLISLLSKIFINRIEVVRGGGVAMELV